MIMMIEIEYGSDDDGEWTSRYRCTFHLPIDWCRRLLVPEGRSPIAEALAKLTCRLTTKVGTRKTPSLCVCGMAL